MFKTTLLLAAMTVFSSPVTAAALDSLAADYVTQDGFTAVDADALWEELNTALTAADQTESVFWPTASMGPMPLAMLALEVSEPPLDRTRYRLTYGVEWVEEPPRAAPIPVSFIEVTRFNLGPAIRQELVDALGEQPVADPSHFGLAPHSAWRLVTRPLMGNQAMVMAAGVREVSEDQALSMRCLGAPCLSTHGQIDALVPWDTLSPDPVDLDVPYTVSEHDVVTPVAAVDLLLGAITLEYTSEHRQPGDAPSVPDTVIEAVVERNLGQDLNLDAAYRWGGLLDDSVAAIWQRLVSFPTGTEVEIFTADAYECARGPKFPEPGQYCP